MHQHAQQHAFTPVLHQSLTLLPTPMGTQDSKSNMHVPRGTSRPSFTPVSVSHRTTQTCFRPAKRGRWGALHVCIAWKIYYQEQIKRLHQKPSSLHQEVTPECSAPSDLVMKTEPEQGCCRHNELDSPCEHSGKTPENLIHFSRSCPSDLYAPPCCSRKLEKPPNLHWKERLAERQKHRSHQTATVSDLPLRDRSSWDRAMTPELDRRHSSSLDRKRPLECDSFARAKRVKQEVVDDQFDSLHLSSHRAPLQLTADYSSRCGVARTHGGLFADIHPYQTASWEPMWDLHSGQKAFVNTCKMMRIPLAAQRPRESLQGFLATPFYLPLTLRQQETVYLSEGEENCRLQRYRHQLTHPGVFAKSYLGP